MERDWKWRRQTQREWKKKEQMQPLGWSCWITMSPLITVSHHESQAPPPRCRTQRWLWWKQGARQQRRKRWRKTHREAKARKILPNWIPAFYCRRPAGGFVTLKGRRLCLLFTHLSQSVGLLHKVCTQHAHTHTHTHNTLSLSKLPVNTQSYRHTRICGESPPAATATVMIVLKWFCTIWF